MTARELMAARANNQHLAGKRLDDAVDVVRWLGAVQAQDFAGAKWALAQRTVGATSARLDQLFAAGAILRTHVLRPTWHFVTPVDIRWLLALTGPRIDVAMASYNRTLELTGALFARSNRTIVSALEGGRQLTRTELAAVLAAAGIRATGHRLAHIVMHAETNGLICSGALRGGQFTYALLDERVPAAPVLAREEALALLAERYFASHGPATMADFIWWSGLTAADARAGVQLAAEVLESEQLDGRTYWFRDRHEAAWRRPVLHLLPNYDEYLVAYKERSVSFGPGVQEKFPSWRDILTAHLVVLNGSVVGIWQRAARKRGVVLTAQLYVELARQKLAALHRALGEYGRFLEVPVELRYTRAPVT